MPRLRAIGIGICLVCASVRLLGTVIGLVMGVSWMLGVEIEKPLHAMFAMGISTGTLLMLLILWINQDLGLQCLAPCLDLESCSHEAKFSPRT